jgi:hypothetical protein
VFESHTHTYNNKNIQRTFEDEPGPLAWEGDTFPQTGATGGNETRPQNIAVNFIIKV